ncbi:MAG: rhomboid family intramembrane serine protease [Gemmatimonadales bacterium]|nr:MAG: rhomboid family intramembrane serine protease [Gemmatimonadales bacterium]
MTPWVLRLLVANVVVFFLTIPLLQEAVTLFGFRPVDTLVRPWTPITYMFLHGGFLHLLFNMIGLFFFGPRLEERLGARHFLGFYLVSGLGGAAASFLTPTTFVIGASGAVFGILLGFARYFPEERIYIWAVLPVKARTVVIFLAAFSLAAGFMGTGGNVAHWAHLGGFVAGWGYLKIMEHRSPARRFQRKMEAATGPRRVSGEALGRWRSVDPSGLHPLNRDEFERVLQKVESKGASSLTPQERAFMERIAGRN